MGNTRRFNWAAPVAALGAAALLGAGGAVVVQAATSPSPAASSSPAVPGHHSGGIGSQRPDETPLAGATAAGVKAAVLAKFPGATILRMETDADGGSLYEAHIMAKDGTLTHVGLDKDFKITSTAAGMGGGRHGHPDDGSATGSSSASTTA